MTEFVRLCDPPEYGRKDRKWALFVSEHYRPLRYDDDEWGRLCGVCGDMAYVVRLDEVNPLNRKPYTRRLFRCPAHAYGIADIVVLVARPLREGS